MKKLLLTICFLFLLCTSVYANPLKIIDVPDDVSYDISFDLSSIPIFYSDTTSYENINLKSFYSFLHPDALDADDIIYYSNLYTVKIPVLLEPSQISNGYVTADASKYIMNLYNKFVLSNPEFFHLVPENYTFGRVSYTSGIYYVSLPAIICNDFPGFDGSSDAIEEIRTQYYSLIDKIESISDSIYFEGITELEMLLFAHDYITNNNVYYTDSSGKHGDGYSSNAYGTLINQKSVCQGYSLAYYAILKKLGFPEENINYVISPNMGVNEGHIWNIVKLNGNWYHVDTTWDDPTYSNYDMTDLSKQKTIHKYFLISSAKNKELRNRNFDMLMYETDNSIINSATDTTYENGYIFNITYINGYLPGIISKTNNGYEIITTGQLYPNYQGNLKLIFDSLRASDYALAQPCTVFISEDGTNEYAEFNSLSDINGKKIYINLFNNNKTTDNTERKFILCFYDKDGRLLKTISLNTSSTAFAIGVSQNFVPENAYTFKIMCLNDVYPMSNTAILTR